MAEKANPVRRSPCRLPSQPGCPGRRGRGPAQLSPGRPCRSTESRTAGHQPGRRPRRRLTGRLKPVLSARLGTAAGSLAQALSLDPQPGPTPRPIQLRKCLCTLSRRRGQVASTERASSRAKGKRLCAWRQALTSSTSSRTSCGTVAPGGRGGRAPGSAAGRGRAHSGARLGRRPLHGDPCHPQWAAGRSGWRWTPRPAPPA
jgi:hypothetical protein